MAKHLIFSEQFKKAENSYTFFFTKLLDHKSYNTWSKINLYPFSKVKSFKRSSLKLLVKIDYIMIYVIMKVIYHSFCISWHNNIMFLTYWLPFRHDRYWQTSYPKFLYFLFIHIEILRMYTAPLLTKTTLTD